MQNLNKKGKKTKKKAKEEAIEEEISEEISEDEEESEEAEQQMTLMDLLGGGPGGAKSPEARSIMFV